MEQNDIAESPFSKEIHLQMVGFHCHVSFRGCSIWLVTMVISPRRIRLWEPFQMAVSWLINWGDPKIILQEGGSNQPLLLHTKIHASKSRWHENIKIYLIWHDMIWYDINVNDISHLVDCYGKCRWIYHALILSESKKTVDSSNLIQVPLLYPHLFFLQLFCVVIIWWICVFFASPQNKKIGSFLLQKSLRFHKKTPYDDKCVSSHHGPPISGGS